MPYETSAALSRPAEDTNSIFNDASFGRTVAIADAIEKTIRRSPSIHTHVISLGYNVVKASRSRE